MKTRVIIYLIGILLLSSCRNCTKNSNNLYDRGVSQELAMQRKENIKNPVYELLFRIPESKDSMVCGDINIDFHISQPQEIIIDFREEQNIHKVRVNENDAAYQICNEHIIIPANTLKQGNSPLATLTI